ncbi:GH92 family glycosyl hydrolase [Pedobacter sp. L105]|uniref:GH92 family glycosyl hydrolase n=1 Tax=Pedobacter sp. L105 TaxID=1641871 RepID=UPI00131CCFD9|nr:GH92 family glycosyl hydrolase [Pedobacter sp. L105]
MQQRSNKKYKAIISSFLVGMLIIAGHSYGQNKTSYVDPLIGSGGHGHVFVGASVPFGAVQVGPDNRYQGWDWCSGYNYGDSVLIGFSQTHLSGTGVGDLGDVLIMPYTGPVRLDKGTKGNPLAGYASRYSHKKETVHPGYYSVKLMDHDIDVELTASERVGFHHYYFPENKDKHIIIDLKEGIADSTLTSSIQQTDPYTFVGYRISTGWAIKRKVFFAIKSSVPITSFSVYNESSLLPGKSGTGNAIKGLINLSANSSAEVQLKIGISPVSTENALANIVAEVPGWNFKQVADAAKAKWEAQLSKIDFQTKDETAKKIFYTALFHTMIDPSLYNDHNGDYRGTDDQIYHHASYANYSIFSLWDTYRATNPLYTIIQPERVGDMVNSMINISKQQGFLPIWPLMGNETFCMSGISSLQVVAEAYLKGIKGFDPEEAYAEIKRTTQLDSLGMNYVRNKQFIPADKLVRSVSKGLEFAISDGSIALMAKKMGHTADTKYFSELAQNYKLYYHPQSKFFRGKNADGAWETGFSAMNTLTTDYSEGNAWEYLWLVPQDVKGLIKLLGGEDVFRNKLDSTFTLPMDEQAEKLGDITGLVGQYAHGNEPGHHIPYLYAYIGDQWKTANRVRQIMKDFYTDQPDGIIGNEDCGQMSAWFILSSMGFYPVFPAGGNYVLGSPVADRVSMNLPGGKVFSLIAHNNSAVNKYIQSARLNGKPYTKSYIMHADIIAGGVLELNMGDKPNKAFGKLMADRP